jgi:hypothetical protein
MSTSTLRINPADLPPVTQAHQREAYERMALRNRELAALSFTAAMTKPSARLAIELLARKIRTDEFKATQARTVRHVKRVVLGVDGHPIDWKTQCVPGPLVARTQDELIDDQSTTEHNSK